MLKITPRRLIKTAFKDDVTPTARAFGLLIAHSRAYPQLQRLLQGLFLVYLRDKFRRKGSYLEFITRIEKIRQENADADFNKAEPLGAAQALYKAYVVRQERLSVSQTETSGKEQRA